MVALIHSKNHAANKVKTAGRYQLDTQPTRIELRKVKASCAKHSLGRRAPLAQQMPS